MLRLRLEPFDNNPSFYMLYLNDRSIAVITPTDIPKLVELLQGQPSPYVENQLDEYHAS